MLLSIRGGASRGLAYFQFWKYMKESNLKFESMSGASAGGIFAALFSCLDTPEQGRDLMKKILGDRAMQWQCDIENKVGSRISRFFKSIGMVVGLRTLFFFSIRKLLKEYVSWEKAESKGIKLYICVVKYREVLLTLGETIGSALKQHYYDQESIKNILEEKFKTISCKTLSRAIQPYFISDDGIYTNVGERFMKIKNTKIQLWKAVLATFWNPLLPTITLPFLGECFDGGLISSYATEPYANLEFSALSCSGFPDVAKEVGFRNIPLWLYCQNPAKVEYSVKPKKYNGFFAFWDSNIEEEFNQEVKVQIVHK